MILRRFIPALATSALLLPALALFAAGGGTPFPDGFKQLAGSPEEFAEMRLPDPSATGVKSKSAMIPVRFDETQKVNAVFTVDVPVDSTEGVSLLLFAPDGPNWQVRVAQPGKKGADLRTADSGVTRRVAMAGLDGNSYPAEVFSFSEARAGTWRVRVTAPEVKSSGNQGYLVVSSRSPYRLYSHADTLDLKAGNRIGLVASMFDANHEAAEKAASAFGGSIESARAEVRFPDGSTQAFVLSETPGRQGVYTAAFEPSMPGDYTAQITVRGFTPEGNAFIRTGEHLLPVASGDVRMGDQAATSLADSIRLKVSIPVSGLSRGTQVNAFAEVWGTDESGEMAAASWIGGMALVQEGGIVPLALDSRWIKMSGLRRPFELRNIRLLDPATSVPLARTDSMPLAVRAFPGGFKTMAVDGITDDMRMGPAPEQKGLNVIAARGLLLVHGYCSGNNPWPTSNFTNYAVFKDLNANRSHDQFAQLIKNFGAQSFNSFGIVAHSQGGAASLHLYTYYWSGLDTAQGNRLIQSVGTPYQGTALAGNLALLGQIFGAGCGSNSSLTYSGAASWLAGIPSWARAKVYYATTSETEVWWRWDYCNVATEPFLNDPEDGVVEKNYGQLPGANNRGHKEGWCHTSGMRDTAQTSDSSRNADMNANAAR